MQVYFFPEEMLVKLNFLHAVPGLTAAFAVRPTETKKTTVNNVATCFLIGKG